MKIFAVLCFAFTIPFTASCNDITGVFDKSGFEFIVELVPNEPDQVNIIDKAISVLKSKINAIGLKGEVEANPSKDKQIIVKIYGYGDLEAVKKYLFTAFQLELRKTISPPNPSPVNIYPSYDEAEKYLAKDQEIFPYISRDGATEEFIIVEKQSIITGEDIRDAQAISYTGDRNNYQISFTLNPDGAKRFGEWTGKNIGNYLAIVLDKKIQSTAFIKSQIFDQGQIDGRFTKQAAEDIVLSLKSGYLPATMKVIEEKPIGK